ncbi:hypothetical protein SAMN06295960_4472 [Paenibacillus aquistagni]|uniref:Uncharacterized protein n=1 Tax=Paenibacillus aquistagni TaxID=1852522 RepID=A0A1X7LUK1_9BACL|nr:hypothetical protein SAMN06295960_4472 [Paenibacillus aquistagni]
MNTKRNATYLKTGGATSYNFYNLILAISHKEHTRCEAAGVMAARCCDLQYNPDGAAGRRMVPQAYSQRCYRP